MEEQNSNNGSLVRSGNRNLQRVSNSIRVTKKLLSASNYESVIIGTQEWMVRNLDVDQFRNGDLIPEIRDDDEWEKAGKEGKPAWCYLENEPEKGEVYGKLYNWHAVNDARGLAPDGWHVPKNAEWSVLVDFLGGQEIAGKKLKAVTETPKLITVDAKSTTEADYLWNKLRREQNEWIRLIRIGTNESGFTGHMAGFRFTRLKNTNQDFHYGWSWRGAMFWSATERDSVEAYTLTIGSSTDEVGQSISDKAWGFSIRCLRDK